MRTTIELSDTNRATLLELAAARGEKGFSAIVAEAIEALALEQGKAARRRRGAAALEAFRRISPETGAEIAENLEEARRSWTR